MATSHPQSTREPLPSVLTVAHLVYALHTIAIVVGIVGAFLGAVIGGFLVGIFENLAGTYIPGVGNELKLPIALALIITVLVFKPAGLLGRPIVKRV